LDEEEGGGEEVEEDICPRFTPDLSPGDGCKEEEEEAEELKLSSSSSASLSSRLLRRLPLLSSCMQSRERRWWSDRRVSDTNWRPHVLQACCSLSSSLELELVLVLEESESESLSTPLRGGGLAATAFLFDDLVEELAGVS
jgi:hypothetical protein